MKKFIIISFFIAFFVEGYSTVPEVKKNEVSENLKITGIVFDSRTSESLTGVEIKILGEENITVFTGFEGEFEIPSLAPGDYTLQINYVSYKKKIIRSVSPGDESIRIELKPDSKQLSSGSDQILNPNA